jgi:hypothetical protein
MKGGVFMRRIIALLAVIATICVSMFHGSPQPAQAQTMVADQTCNTGLAGGGALTGAIWKAQTFVPHVTGNLVQVVLPGVHTGGITTLRVRTTVAGKPTGPDLGSASIGSGTTFTFGGGIALVTGQQYALVLSNTGSSTSYTWNYSNSAACYLQGYSSTSTNGGTTWSSDVVDFFFTTYISPVAAPAPLPVKDQRTTCIIPPGGAVAVSGAIAKAQTFVAGMTGKLAHVELPGSNNAGGSTTLHIRATNASGVPTGSDLPGGSSTILCGKAFKFSSGPTLTAGSRYALVIDNTGGSFSWGYSSSATCYPNVNGAPYTFNGTSWSQDTVDFYFITYISPDTLAVTAPAAALPVRLDQTTLISPAGHATLGGSVWKAQTFLVSGSGTVTLRRVELPGAHASGTTTLHIRATDASGKPSGGDLPNGASSITSGNIFSFPAGVSLTGGATIALVLESTGSYTWSYSNSATCYYDTRGTPYTGTSGGSWSPDIVDFYFITYTGSAASPTVYQTCTAAIVGGANVSGSAWKGQTFVASGSGSVTLARVELAGFNNGGTTTLHIRATDAGGKPTGGDLPNGASSISGGNVFDFSAGVVLTGGARYALVLENSSGGYVWQYSGCRDCYSAGVPFTGASGGSWSADIVDFYFTTYMRAAAGSPPTPLPPIWRGPALKKPTVFVASFATGTQLYDPQALTEQLIARLSEGSRYHGYANVNTAIKPYFEFQIYGNTIRKYPGLPAKQSNGNYDYNAIYTYYGLCSLLQSRQIDEVWFWDAGQGGFAEWVTTGPEWVGQPAFNQPLNCGGREVTTMTFNYNRQLDAALESYNHRLEYLFQHYFPCEFLARTVPSSSGWLTWPARCDGLVSDNHGYVARAYSTNGGIAACGDAHNPPNTPQSAAPDAGDRIYNSTTSVPSICQNWREDGIASTTSINCTAWGCNQEQYHIWWMQNLPGVNNTNRDWNGTLHPNWWTYLFEVTPTQ